MTREERPYCYGKLECVFPMGENGLRETPESCMVCYCKTECLRTAMQGEAGDRAYLAMVLMQQGQVESACSQARASIATFEEIGIGGVARLTVEREGRRRDVEIELVALD